MCNCCCRGRPTDIYALGACLFTFVYGRIPFSAPTVYQLFQVVQTEPLRFPEEPLVSDDLKDLLSQMLVKVGQHASNEAAWNNRNWRLAEPENSDKDGHQQICLLPCCIL